MMTKTMIIVIMKIINKIVMTMPNIMGIIIIIMSMMTII